MSDFFANRLLTKAETGETARRYHVGITSVLRRCVSSGNPRLTRRAAVSPHSAGPLFRYIVVPSFGAFGFLALAELAWERWEMVKGEFVEPRAWLAPVTVGLSAFALHLALFGWEAP